MKYLLTLNVILLLGVLALAGLMFTEKREFFAGVPAEDVHTMRVWEDGSFEIVYKDKGLGQTSEVGCLPEGGCND